MEFAAKFKISLKWYDKRLTFVNLKSKPEFANLLSKDDMNEVNHQHLSKISGYTVKTVVPNH